MTMRIHAATAVLGATIALAGCTTPAADNLAGAAPPAAPPTEALEAVPMVNHVQFGVFEQDVFVERLGGAPGQVYRATPADAANPLTAEAPLFTTAAETQHDPAFANEGPFDKGHALGVTLSQWLAARGSAAYLCTGGAVARIDGSYTGLVPNGVYTFWNARLDFTGGHITGGEDIAAGPRDGSRNTFTADKDGNARFAVTWDGCNAPSTGGPGIGPDGSATVLAIAYHSDGRTYGASPGPFGQHSHVQLFGFARAAQV